MALMYSEQFFSVENVSDVVNVASIHFYDINNNMRGFMVRMWVGMSIRKLLFDNEFDDPIAEL